MGHLKRVMNGGGRNTAPKPGSDLPDITDATTLKNNMEFYNLLGHGAMYKGEHRVFLVPENTWILFVTRAGIPADKRKSGVLREVLDDFYFLKEGETPREWYERIYSGMKDGSLFQRILYSGANPDLFSIYEPGDLVQDLSIQFMNHSWPFMRLGIWKCPMPTSVKEYLNTINNTEEIAKYNDELKRILGELDTFHKELPTHRAAITKIITFIKNYSNVTAEEAERFSKDPAVETALENKEIGKKFRDALDIFQGSALFGRGLENQNRFYSFDNNLIKYSPSAYGVTANRHLTLDSTLYQLLNETRYTFPFDGSSVPRVAANTPENKLLATPKYRFIVVDACRSIESLSLPKELYIPRAKLTRRLSMGARATDGEICYNSLLQLTRTKFEELVRSRGENINTSSALVKLLRGENIPVPEFEASLVAKNTLRNVLARGFQSGDIVFFINREGRPEQGVIVDPGIRLTRNGKLEYTVMKEDGDVSNVPVEAVFKSPEDFVEMIGERELEIQEATRVKEELNRESEGVRLGKIAEKAAAKRLEKQKEVWDQRYRQVVKDRFGDKFGEMNTYRPSSAISVRPRIQKGNIAPGSIVYVENKWISPDGKIGYVVGMGGKKKFYNLINIDTPEKLEVYKQLLNKLPQSQRFPKGSPVKIKGLTSGGAKYNDLTGIVVDIYERAGIIFYRVQIEYPSKTVLAIPVKPENVEAAPDGTIVALPPINTTYLPTAYTSLALSPEEEAAIQDAATRDVNAELGRGAEGGKRRTRRFKPKKGKTKRRASKH